MGARVQLREYPEADRERVDEIHLDADQFMVALVDPGAARSFLRILPASVFTLNPGLARNSNTIASWPSTTSRPFMETE